MIRFHLPQDLHAERVWLRIHQVVMIATEQDQIWMQIFVIVRNGHTSPWPVMAIGDDMSDFADDGGTIILRCGFDYRLL